MTRVALRVSHLDQWIWYQRSGTLDDAEFVARLEGRAPYTEAARIGTAFHACMERELNWMRDIGAEGTTLSAFSRGITAFDFRDTLEIDAGGARTEVRASALLEDVADGVDVELTGHADAQRGRRIWDWKTTSKAIDLERYQRSMQWRSYLMLHDADRFTYGVFRLAVPKSEDGVWVYRVVESETLDCWRYPEMEEDVRRVAGELGEWCAAQGVLCV